MFRFDACLAPARSTIAILIPLLTISPTWAHESAQGWSYPYSCCANHDCKSMATSAISEKVEGYVVQETGEVVGYTDRRIRDSPDGQFHWCAHQSGVDAGRTICLFVPPRAY